MAPQFSPEVALAIQAVIKAAQICRNVQKSMGTDALAKKDHSPVTIADYASQAVICKEIQEAFPEELIVGEEDSGDLKVPENQAFLNQTIAEIQSIGIEAGPDSVLGWIDAGNHDGTADRYWTLDPIDGTKGFLRKEQFAISLALLIEKKIQVTALACPNLPMGNGMGVVFYAERDKGAWAVPLDATTSNPVQIHVSRIVDVAEARVCESVESGHSSHDLSSLVLQKLGVSGNPVRMDSQAKYGAVARGDAEIYLRLPTRAGYEEKIWDHAGGVLVVEEAGGTVTDIDGRPLDFSVGRTLRNNRGVAVSNGPFHPEILAALNSLTRT